MAAEVTLTLRRDPQTGRRTLVIHFESEQDALPWEHERDHRAFVEALLGVPLAEVADEVEVVRAGAAAPEVEGEGEAVRQAERERR